VAAKREVYVEVINKDLVKTDLVAENMELKRELQEMKNKYEPEINASAIQVVKEKNLKMENKKLP
jgi:hypothetical protein